MSESILAAFAVLVVPLFCGDAVLRLLRARDLGLARPALALVAGGLLFAPAVAVATALGLPRPEIVATVATAVVGVAAHVASRRRTRAATAPTSGAAALPTPRRFSRTERAFFALVVVGMTAATLDRVVVSSAGPVSTGDEAVIWGAKARLLAGVDDGFSAIASRLVRLILADPPLPTVAHPDYPPLLPAWASAAIRFDGDPAARLARLPAQAVSIALPLALAAALRRRVRPAAAAALLLAFGARASLFDGLLMADGAVALGLLLAGDFAARAARDRSRVDAALSALALVFAAWSKNEGATGVPALLVGLVWARIAKAPGARLLAIPVICGAAAVGAVFALNAATGCVNDHLADAHGESFVAHAREKGAARVGEVASRIARDVVFSLESTAGLFLLAVLAAAAAGRRGVETPVLFAATFVPFAAYAAIFVGTYHDFGGHWATAGVRVFGHLTALAALLSAASLAAASPSFAAHERTDV